MLVDKARSMIDKFVERVIKNTPFSLDFKGILFNYLGFPE